MCSCYLSYVSSACIQSEYSTAFKWRFVGGGVTHYIVQYWMSTLSITDLGIWRLVTVLRDRLLLLYLDNIGSYFTLSCNILKVNSRDTVCFSWECAPQRYNVAFCCKCRPRYNLCVRWWLKGCQMFFCSRPLLWHPLCIGLIPLK